MACDEELMTRREPTLPAGGWSCRKVQRKWVTGLSQSQPQSQFPPVAASAETGREREWRERELKLHRRLEGGRSWLLALESPEIEVLQTRFLDQAKS
ncbi:hypothetical protein JCGZ_13821 [Jatropha curcas]|uniref:Uncharacterized protein n=1 Tax=Jatropha curcas TaxID=180498 RepID=A0A067KKA4_JATCU|nr:hypothetical protein JCGZ_13821 [Jatropha curcas]